MTLGVWFTNTMWREARLEIEEVVEVGVSGFSRKKYYSLALK